MNDLRLTLVQGATRWHDPDGNRAYYGGLIAPLRGSTDLVILPETFTSGFSNEAIERAETLEGPTVAWMREQARALGAAVTGSVQLRDGGGVYNRLLWVTPDGGLRSYDKRHLFRYAREHEHYAAGRHRLTVEWKGWRICPLVCYDLRFPVFSRNRFDSERPGAPDYDLLLYVANWPAARAYAWTTLLRARAIENLCYVAGLNRVGTDGNGLVYSGDSAVLDFLGQPLSELGEAERVDTVTLSAGDLASHRAHFPAMLDADRFELDAPPPSSAPAMSDADQAKLLRGLAMRLGPAHVLTEPAEMAGYLAEQRGLYRSEALAVVRPATVEEVAFVVGECAARRVPVVPQGGNTGLVGGAVAQGGIIAALTLRLRPQGFAHD